MDLITAGTRLIETEAMLLDERRWEEWIELFAEDCTYWVPTWRNDSELTNDPQTELSHIYYATRQGLEDRVQRALSGLSPASTPGVRTIHTLSSILPTAAPEADRIAMRCNWTSSIYWVRNRAVSQLFGTARYALENVGDRLLIKSKKITIYSDYIPTMFDFYYI
jgi:benzoate/toluate 1,2-dioxygenase beta subunit